jgi:hypothetical protein
MVGLGVVQTMVCGACGGVVNDGGHSESSGVGGGGSSGGAPATPCVDVLVPDANRVTVAVFNESASTNSPPYQYVLSGDGSAAGTPTAVLELGVPRPACDLPPQTAEVLACVAALRAIGDVSLIPISADCFKSASYGSETTVTYDGFTSGDLQCVFDAAYRDVLQDCARFIGG